MTAANGAPDALRVGDKVEFVAHSPLYEAGLRSGVVVSVSETVAEFLRREARRYGMTFRQAVARGQARRGRRMTDAELARRLPVVELDPAGRVLVPGMRVPVEASHMRRVGPAGPDRN